jgi:uncharacterized repeat protein (TIGR03803 family)
LKFIRSCIRELRTGEVLQMMKNQITEFVAVAMRCRCSRPVLGESSAKAERRRRSILGKLILGRRVSAVFLLCLATATASFAQTLTTLHSFDSTDGYAPSAGLVQATNGDFYGTTMSGGASGIGTVFKITPSGTLTLLHSFDGTDGQELYAALMQATNGNLYGTTANGGANGNYGTVFEITLGGKLTTRHSFDGTDGENPLGALIQATNGNFYGTTALDGDGYGTVFEITPNGKLTTVHYFDDTNGAYPGAGLVQATNGEFYGTTVGGGAHNAGTVFKMTASGTLTKLYDFCSQTDCQDGAYPSAALIQAADGSLYGTTYQGGVLNSYCGLGCGTVFKITPSGKLKTLYTFCSLSNCTDGAWPYVQGVVQATDGNLYGTTYGGGNNSVGTVFRMTTSGTLKKLYDFCSQGACTDGSYPEAAPIQDTNGDFYGTTQGGGAHAYGTVYRLSVGLGPFVETLPTSGKVGSSVNILGTKLTGATSVNFNGTAATFTVVSGSEIKATVPAGATTGKVQVKTPSGTLTSNVNFRVP